jgi:hypothetical protein
MVNGRQPERKESMGHKLSAILVATAMVVMMGWALAPPAYAVCDVAQSRVVHAETVGDAVGATTTIFFLSQGLPTPTFYFVFSTSNQMFINHLNAAHAGNLQVRVRGDAAACPATGTLRAGGTILRVFRDSFF